MATRFTSFGFASSGGTALRTMPARLAEVHNILDFGADSAGGNATATTAAIQAAVDVVSGTGRGTVYFPRGFYSINAPITFNLADISIRFRGEGTGTTVSANFNGFAFDRHLASPSNTAFVIFEKMSVQNGNASGATSGGIRIGSTTQAAIRDMQIGGFIGLTTEDSAGNSSQNIFIENSTMGNPTHDAGSTGLIIGGSGAMVGSYFRGCDIAVRAYGSGLNIAGMRIENCNTAYLLGLDSAGTDAGMSAFSMSGSTEGCITAIDMAGVCTGGFIGPISALGHDAAGSGESALTPSLYGVRVRAGKAQACAFFNISAVGCDTAAISIENASSRANNSFISCSAGTGGAGLVAWVLPTNAYTAQFVQCNTAAVWTLSQLPSGGDVLEGDEFNISDSSTATWGANVTTTGSNHVLVRWNGSNWTVVGK